MASGKFISTRSISATKTFYGNKCIFKLVCLVRKAGDQRFVGDIAEKSLNRLLLLLIWKTSHQRCSAKKKVLLGNHLYWSLFSIMLQVCNFIKRESNAGVFPVPFAKFLTAPTLTNLFYFCAVSSQVILFTIHERYS